MKRVIEFFAFLVLIAIQVTLWPQITQVFAPALVLAAAFAWGFNTSVTSGFRVAFAGGIILDLYTQQHFGMYTLANSIAYAVVFLVVRSRSDEVGWGLIIPIIAAGSILYELIILAWISLTTANVPFFALLFQVATLNSISTVLAFGVLYAIVSLYIAKTAMYEPRPLPKR